MRKPGLLAIVLLAGLTAAYADTITLVGPIATHDYQQTTNSPCVIGNNSCQNPAGFGVTILASGSESSYDNIVSPTYTVGQIVELVGTSFWVGIDVNQTSVSQSLDLFKMTVDGTDVATFSTLTSIPASNNGNGYADYLLETFSLAGYASDATVTFTMDMPIANDGAEQFFLVSAGTPAPAAPPVPEPSTIALLGTGLVSAAGLVRRRAAR